jgi:hypothetical protein
LLRHEETNPRWQGKVVRVQTMASMLSSGNEHTMKKLSELEKKEKIRKNEWRIGVKYLLKSLPSCSLSPSGLLT